MDAPPAAPESPPPLPPRPPTPQPADLGRRAERLPWQFEPDRYEDGVPVYMVPNMAECQFNAFAHHIYSVAGPSGICKVIPVGNWDCPREDIALRLSKLIVKKAIKQEVTAGGLPSGAYVVANMEQKRNYTVQEFYDAANHASFAPPSLDQDGKRLSAAPVIKKSRKAPSSKIPVPVPVPVTEPSSVEATEELPAQHTDATLSAKVVRKKPPTEADINFDVESTSEGWSDERCALLEKHYWKNLTYVAPMYGADMQGSLFGEHGGSWNLGRLDNLLNRVKVPLPGVNTPYLYFGMWKATFAWHVEDMDLCSINYIHFGAPKQWYVIPLKDRARFETLARSTFSVASAKCPEFLRHKTSIMSPSYLAANGIKPNKIIQRAGEIIITFPYGYHQGYNLGFNCAESTNFALDSWLEIGKQAKYCQCVPDSVHVDVAGIFDPPTEPVTPEPEPEALIEKRKRDVEPVPKPVLLINAMRRVKKPRSQVKKPATVQLIAPPRAPIAVPVRKCILCPSVNGEFLSTPSSNVFVHRQCATYVPEVWTDVDPSAPGKLIADGLQNISSGRWALKCAICKQTGKVGKRGAPIQCAKGQCKRAYHVTCAQESGKVFFDAFPDEAQIPSCFCPQHVSEEGKLASVSREQAVMASFGAFPPGTPVTVQTANSWYWGIVESVLSDLQSYKVQFCTVDAELLQATSRVVPWSAARLRQLDIGQDDEEHAEYVEQAQYHDAMDEEQVAHAEYVEQAQYDNAMDMDITPSPPAATPPIDFLSSNGNTSPSRHRAGSIPAVVRPEDPFELDGCSPPRKRQRVDSLPPLSTTTTRHSYIPRISPCEQQRFQSPTMIMSIDNLLTPPTDCHGELTPLDQLFPDANFGRPDYWLGHMTARMHPDLV
ncbi:hypothetical protein HKX48_006867 [Thoreauomyces humboldtii]|nr:hypothetical protein HKX48_006867 [Thoreauomyces humboldtii]